LKESLAHFRAPDISHTRTSDWVAISNLFAMLTFSPLRSVSADLRFGDSIRLGRFCASDSHSLDRRRCRNSGIHVAGLNRNSRHRTWGLERYESLVMGSLLL
jgi:hypothetical protein